MTNISNMFVDHFSSAFTNATATSEELNLAILNCPQDIMRLHCPTFSLEDVKNAASKLKCSTSPGPDGIPTIILKSCAHSLSLPLSMIFNKSTSMSIFPTKWKHSVMFPVYKKGDKREISNYRGITSLSAGSKLLEILISDFMFQSVKQYLSTDQHGFYPGRSTNTNLVEFTSYCIRNMEKGIQIDTVYTDLKAAFDRVNHRILLAKLSRLGATPSFVQWMKSYLMNRKLKVRIGNTESQSFSNVSGVPQGSNMGPLLFAVYFNDVCFVLPPKCRLLYADDLKIFLEINSVEDCKKLQLLINMFVMWCRRNLLTVSTTKCSVISFTRCKTPLNWCYTIENCCLERVTSIKDLGVLLDAKMTFVNHYESTIAKANRNLGFIMRIGKEFKDPYCLKVLFCSLVRSHLENCVIVWCPFAANWINRLEAIQRKFTRFALRFLPWQNPLQLPPYRSRCDLLGMQTLDQRRNLLKTMFVAKILLGEIDAPAILEKINLNVIPRTLRSREPLRLNFHRTGYGQYEPIRAMCSTFNEYYECFDYNLSSSVIRSLLLHEI